MGGGDLRLDVQRMNNIHFQVQVMMWFMALVVLVCSFVSHLGGLRTQHWLQHAVHVSSILFWSQSSKVKVKGDTGKNHLFLFTPDTWWISSQLLKNKKFFLQLNSFEISAHRNERVRHTALVFTMGFWRRGLSNPSSIQQRKSNMRTRRCPLTIQ